MPYDVLFNAILQGEQGDAPRPIVRYLQVGIVDADGFSGVVTDYCGGGEWDDLYYLRGRPIEPGDIDPDLDEDEADELNGDDYQDCLARHYPGLPAAIGEATRELTDWNDQGPGGYHPVARPALLDQRVVPTDPIISNALGRLDPVEGFHTTFDDDD